MSRSYRLKGFDAFSGEYELEGEHGSLGAAEAAARVRLEHLERSQPSSSSGGQTEHGIQDRVYIETPTGRLVRYTGGVRLLR